MTNLNDIASDYVEKFKHVLDGSERAAILQFAYTVSIAPKEEVNDCVVCGESLKNCRAMPMVSGDWNGPMKHYPSCKPQEPVKECDHTASCVHCWDKQYPQSGGAVPPNKSTGVKIEPLNDFAGRVFRISKDSDVDIMKWLVSLQAKLNEVIAHINK